MLHLQVPETGRKVAIIRTQVEVCRSKSYRRGSRPRTMWYNELAAFG